MSQSNQQRLSQSNQQRLSQSINNVCRKAINNVCHSERSEEPPYFAFAVVCSLTVYTISELAPRASIATR